MTVSASDGTNQHRRFTGKVDGSSSSLGDLGVSIPLVDDTDRLSAPVSHDTVFRTMPPLPHRGESDRRMTGMLSTYVTNLAARAAGFYSTPPMGGFCTMSAPLAGSTWPERGVLSWSGRHTAIKNEWNALHPGASALGDSMFMADLLAYYEPDHSDLPYRGGITDANPLRITLGANQMLENSGYVETQWVTDWGLRSIRLAVTGTRTLTAQIYADSALVENVVSLRGEQARGWRFATLTVRPSTVEGSTAVTFEIETDTGHTASGWANEYVSNTMRTTLWDRVLVYAPPYVGMNGVQVNHGGYPPARGFARTFLFRPDDPLANMDVLPHLSAVPARDLLEQQAEVECAAVWIDEDGVLRWLGHRRMVEGPIVRTLTSSEIADATISVDSQDVRRKVTGTWKTWATKTMRQHRIMVYEGQRDEYEAGDHGEHIITPPEDEEWVMVDETLLEIWGNIGSTVFNNGHGSFHGYTAMREDGSEIPFASGDGDTDWSFGPIGPGAWKWTFDVKSLPSGSDRVRTSTRSEDTDYVKAAYRGLGLPLLRSMGRATATDDTYTPGDTGPSWASDLDLDFGWWVQHRSQAITKIQRIAVELKKPRAMLSNFEVLADPRLQLGDKIKITEPARTGLSVIGIVTALPESLGAGEHTMTLSLNVLEVTTPYLTIGEFSAIHEDMTLGSLAAKYADSTLGGVGARTTY